jgi:hypothetical protein
MGGVRNGGKTVFLANLYPLGTVQRYWRGKDIDTIDGDFYPNLPYQWALRKLLVIGQATLARALCIISQQDR